MKTKEERRNETLAMLINGKSIQEAEKLTAERGLTLRVIAEDGIPYAATCDYRLDRINVELIDSRVVNASIG